MFTKITQCAMIKGWFLKKLLKMFTKIARCAMNKDWFLKKLLKMFTKIARCAMIKDWFLKKLLKMFSKIARIRAYFMLHFFVQFQKSCFRSVGLRYMATEFLRELFFCCEVVRVIVFIQLFSSNAICCQCDILCEIKLCLIE